MILKPCFVCSIYGCKTKHPISTDGMKFIHKARKVHRWNYGYERMKYVNSNKKIVVVYQDVGYEITPSKHLYRQCREIGCFTRPSYGPRGEKAIYCKKHALDGYVDVINKKCNHLGCDTIPNYGNPEDQKAIYCKRHAYSSHIDVINKKCIHLGCNTIPNYGKPEDKKAIYCKKHALDGYVDVKNKRCIYPNCYILSNYGKPEDQKAIYCKKHALDGYVDVKNKRCIHPNCYTLPTYSKLGNKAVYCKRHALDGCVNVVNKICIHPNCNKSSNYGKLNDKKAIYCAEHATNDCIDIRHKKCLYPDCNTIPNYGKPEDKKAIYCKKHALDGYVDVIGKKCIHPNCDTRPNYGPRGGTKKDAVYCKRHAPGDYVDVAHTRCIHPNCDTRSNYGFLGRIAQYCANHKLKNMIANPRKRCSECKNWATYVKDNIFYCVEHVLPEKSLPLDNVCTICFQVYSETGICDGCSKFDGKTVKRKEKELMVKNTLHGNNIPISSYDKIITGSCSKKRPDFIIDTQWGCIVLEVDEFQHQKKTYTCDCEIARMKQIYFDIGTEYVLYIRYNPDNYKTVQGRSITTTKRLEYLRKYIQEKMNTCPKYNASVVYLFYDFFTNPLEEDLNPYS